MCTRSLLTQLHQLVLRVIPGHRGHPGLFGRGELQRALGIQLPKLLRSLNNSPRNLFTFVPVVCLYESKEELMMKIALTAALAAAVLLPGPLLVGSIPAEAQNLKMAQVDVQAGL